MFALSLFRPIPRLVLGATLLALLAPVAHAASQVNLALDHGPAASGRSPSMVAMWRTGPRMGRA